MYQCYTPERRRYAELTRFPVGAHTDGVELAAAKRLFETLLNYTKVLAPGFQLIVTERANLADD